MLSFNNIQELCNNYQMENYTITSIVLFPIIFILLPLLYLSLKSRQSKLPPGPKPWPIIGNILLLGDKPHQSVAKLSKIYGPLMSLKLGSITTIVISSPTIAKEMFLKHDLAFSSRNVPDVRTIDNHDKLSIVWLPVCPKWRDLRKIATIQLFTNQRLDATRDLRRKKVEELVGYARQCCEQGLALDIGKAAFTTSLNLLSNTFFSMNLGSHDSSWSQEFKELVWNLLEEGAKPNVSDYFPILKRFDLQGAVRRVSRYVDKLMAVFEDIIDERLKNSTEAKDDVLNLLINLVKENELSLHNVKHMLFDLFLAGTDTTSSTVEWAMAELQRHPEKMLKAQAEIDQVIPNDGFVQEMDISKLAYIQAIVKETLRLHPPAPFLIPHKTVKDVQLCDYTVPKNALVWVNVWSIGRDPSVWTDPDSFVPERFLEREIDFKGRNFELIPFGAGRRTCPGMPLAYRMTHLMLATLLHSFDWKLSDGVNPENLDMEEKFGITVQKVQPLQLIPAVRGSRK
uniref:Cytochrome P450 CYP76AD16 n=1 Tax=Cleretum bellidiforme TaxID=90527 RepID=A0A0U1YJK7_CLEBE|nr:cytochrome P450 CYP76AD16 [Cleretum bellidiforme]